MIFLAIIVVGLVAGFLADRVVGRGRGFSQLETFIAGLAGSLVGGTLFSLLLGEGFDLRLGGFIGATVGAIIVLGLYGLVRGRQRPA
ncbi:MAG TPA: GlsB/YeaQ/YmgE family stress response membrane protein [Candidatus Limnocylindrales bacterium]|jgi:uncharacterized membrane protein YeaQ/YmgE (transglycosylase-associated protein family)